VHDAAATRGQYLALSKAWWSCCFVCLCERWKWRRSLFMPSAWQKLQRRYIKWAM